VPPGFDEEDVDQEELAELLEDLEAVEETVDSRRERRVIRRTIRVVGRLSRGRMFGLDDVAQQVVGGFVLSAPFVVTEEVWSLAASMNWLQTAVTVAMVLAIGYGTLYRAEDRDPDAEVELAGVPLRFVSLVLISYGSVTTLALVFDAPDAFGATPLVTLKAICIGAIFGVVGAATADSLF
jgi:uncharacterized membrane protein